MIEQHSSFSTTQQKIQKFDDAVWKFVNKSSTFVKNICWIVKVGEVQRNANLIAFVKSFLTSTIIQLQKSASIQPRTNPLKLRTSFNFHNFSGLQGFNFHRAVVSQLSRASTKRASSREAAAARSAAARSTWRFHSGLPGSPDRGGRARWKLSGKLDVRGNEN